MGESPPPVPGPRIAGPAATAATERDTLAGILMILVSALVLASSDVAVKALTETLPAIEIVWLRFVSYTLIVGTVILVRRRKVKLHVKRHDLQILRGLFAIGSATLFSSGLAYLPVGDATSITFAAPLMVTALSVIILKEKVGLRRWTATAIGFCGILLMVAPGTASFRPAALFPLASALCWALTLIATRAMGSAEQPLATLLYSAATGLVVTTPLTIPFFVPLGPEQLLLGAWVGLTTTIGHGLIVLSYQRAPASILAPISYSQVPWSMLLGYLVFGSVPTVVALVGLALVAGSGIYISRREARKKRASEPTAPPSDPVPYVGLDEKDGPG